MNYAAMTDNPNAMAAALLDLWGPSINLAKDRAPDLAIHHSDAGPNLLRWYLTPRNEGGCVYLHQFTGIEGQEVPHCHPADSMSVCVFGHVVDEEFGTVELTQNLITSAKYGTVRFRQGRNPHRIVSAFAGSETLFFTGPRHREWGFYVKGEGRGMTKFYPWEDVTRNEKDEAGTMHSYLEIPG